MSCETLVRAEQTLRERVDEVKKAITRLDGLIRDRKVLVKVGPKGGITFDGWSPEDRKDITDACAFRLIMTSGSVLAKGAIAKAEMMSGRQIDRKVIAHGHHSHDGGKTWHDGH